MTTASEKAKTIIADLLLERLGQPGGAADCDDCCSNMGDGGCELDETESKLEDLAECPQSRIFCNAFAEDALELIKLAGVPPGDIPMSSTPPFTHGNK